jgi:hypothetical protein
MRKREDRRYPLAVEAGWAILQKHYGYEDNEEVRDNTGLVRREGPDLWTYDKKVAITIGTLREDVLLRYLRHFDEVVHLPLPTEGVDAEPTHLRVFTTNRARAFDKKNFTIWGDGLLKGRTERE